MSIRALLKELSEAKQSKEDAFAEAEPHLKKAAQVAEKAFKGWKVPVGTGEDRRLETVVVRSKRSTRRDGPEYTVFVSAGRANRESLDMFMDISVSTIGGPPEISVSVGRLQLYASNVMHGTSWFLGLKESPTAIKKIVADLRKKVEGLFKKYHDREGRRGWAK